MCIFLLLIFEPVCVESQRSTRYVAAYCTMCRIQILGICLIVQQQT